jgi:hypothetical protein
MTLRTQWGDEGSDQMCSLILLAGGAGMIRTAEQEAATIAALFIGSQVSLSYVASGLAKLSSPVWRSGSALTRIMNHHTYGHAGFAGFLKSANSVGAVLSALVMAFQITFLFYYALPMPFALAYIAGGVLFHAGIAYFMRLNLFFIYFVAAYPPLIFTHWYLWRVLGLT